MKITVGLVDYGVGNHTSVRQALLELGFRCRVTADEHTLDQCHLLLLPGVGAFRPAITALRLHGLDQYLVRQQQAGRPVLGICLGMQLLAEQSDEGGVERGLGLIAGQVTGLGDGQWHIGWNVLEPVGGDPFFAPSAGESFYFNHAFAFADTTPDATALARASRPFAAAVRRDNVAGVQFHPEKSQDAGRRLLSRLIEGMVRG